MEIHYTSKGIDHFCNDAMLELGDKYFSRKSMLHVDEIIAKATYIPTNHQLAHERKDNRSLWFAYKDNDGRGMYFKVARNDDNKGHYELTL